MEKDKKEEKNSDYDLKINKQTTISRQNVLGLSIFRHSLAFNSHINFPFFIHSPRNYISFWRSLNAIILSHYMFIIIIVPHLLL